MSDERGAVPHKDPIPYVHYCEHPGCKKWGAFGFDSGGAEPNWFCFEHRPEWKTGSPSGLPSRNNISIT
ncbi:hypothetical protein M728_001413 [Ensifer sp. WSM1721]|uniref:hypothetical protein n=1 Tax=Ensifer sp. WSM1721 TaxID=1041159 RepID=UPI0004B4BBC9|nr:hypothetical protein [Ensifer sp. WSM1721]